MSPNLTRAHPRTTKVEEGDGGKRGTHEGGSRTENGCAGWSAELLRQILDHIDELNRRVAVLDGLEAFHNKDNLAMDQAAQGQFTLGGPLFLCG